MSNDDLGGELQNGQSRMAFDWLCAELDNANAHIAAYASADQKIISLMGTIVVAILGISFSVMSKSGAPEENRISYILFLASALISLAVLQSLVYNSLSLLFMERKTKLSDRLESFLKKERDFAHTAYGLFNLEYKNTYEKGIFVYYLFKSSASLTLVLAGALYSPDFSNYRWDASLTFAAMLAVTNPILAFSHSRELKKFRDFMMERVAADRPS